MGFDGMDRRRARAYCRARCLAAPGAPGRRRGKSVTSVLKQPAGGADREDVTMSQGESAMHFMRQVLGYGRDFVLAMWAIGVLAFCVLGLAGAIR